MVRGDRVARDLGHFPIPLGPCRDRSPARARLSRLRRSYGISCPRRGLPLRHRRRGVVCRHGAFRRGADPARLVGHRLPEPRSELRGPGSPGPRRRSDLGQHLLPAVSFLLAAAADCARHDRDDHRQPVDHYRRIFHDAPSDPTWLAAAGAHHPDLGRGLWPDLRGAVNWLLMLVTLGLTVGFGKSDNLASAYGIAVSATMLMTSALLFIAMREIWGWSAIAAGAVAGAFFLVDAAFFAANLIKVTQGGYVPLILAALVYGVMLIWHIGATAVTARLQDEVTPVGGFMAKIAEKGIPRVPGTAVFLTRTERDVPPVMVWHVKHNRALHERLFVL